MRKYILKTIGTLALVTMMLAAVGCGGQSPKTENTVSLTVSAAASLTDAMKEIKDLYAKEKPNVSITLNLESSGALQQQIEQGAPADVFMSAAPKQIDALQGKGLLLDGSRKDLLQNKIVLVVPSGSTAGIADFKDLTGSQVKKIAIGEPKSVPAGQYASEVFTFLNISDKLKDKLVLAKDVRQVLTYVETGEVDAGIVFLTDAKTSSKVKVVSEASESSHSKVIYPAAIIKSSKNVDAAKDFMVFLSSNQAKSVFEKYGFTALSK